MPSVTKQMALECPPGLNSLQRRKSEDSMFLRFVSSFVEKHFISLWTGLVLILKYPPIALASFVSIAKFFINMS